MSDSTYWQCVRLYRSGLRPQEIVEQGIPEATVFRCIQRARRREDIVAHSRTARVPLPRMLRGAGLSTGNIGQLDDELTYDQSQWLVDQAVKLGCESALEVIAELIRDAHEESKTDV